MPALNEAAGEGLPVTDLADAFRLLKAEKKTGVLRVIEGQQYARFYLREGAMYYADSSSSGAPLGTRLVRRGRITRKTLAAAEAEVEESEELKLLGEVLKEREVLPDEVLAAFLRDQIVDAMLNAFLKEEAEVDVVYGWGAVPSHALVALDPDKVADRGRQWAQEWKEIMGSLGSLEKVPHLTVPSVGSDITLSRSRWEVVCFIDGRRDINTIVLDSGMDRFHTARSVNGLIEGGLAKSHDPTLELLGQKQAVAVMGPIDMYNITLLASASADEVSSHTRLEHVGDEEVEVRISAVIRQQDDEEGVLLYSSEARTPPSVIRRMALETSGYIVLVNRNSRDAVMASRSDIALMEGIGDRPYIVATYASLEDEKMEESQVRKMLNLPEKVPVWDVNLRDSEDIGNAVDALLKMTR